jgi:hypothetical protein
LLFVTNGTEQRGNQAQMNADRRGWKAKVLLGGILVPAKGLLPVSAFIGV